MPSYYQEAMDTLEKLSRRNLMPETLEEINYVISCLAEVAEVYNIPTNEDNE